MNDHYQILVDRKKLISKEELTQDEINAAIWEAKNRKFQAKKHFGHWNKQEKTKRREPGVPANDDTY